MNDNQMHLDIVLDHKRGIKDNIVAVVDFIYKKNVTNDAEKITNKHEGYGIAAEKHAMLKGDLKSVNADMDSLLKLLSSDVSSFANQTTSLYNSAVMTAITAINLAVAAKRIMDDLYYSVPTPIEDYIEDDEENEEGFENAEEVE